MRVLVTMMKTLARIRRLQMQYNDPGVAEAARLAYWLRLALVGFLVTGIFLSCAYSELFFVLCGLTLALQRSISRSLVTVAAPPSPALPAPRA